MSSSIQIYQDGNAVQSESDISKYTGINRSDYPNWLKRLNLKLTLNKQKPWVKGIPWTSPNQSEFRKREDELIDEDNFTHQDEADGYQIGQFRISLSQMQKYKKAVTDDNKDKALSFSIVTSMIADGSPADLIARKFKANFDFDSMMSALDSDGRSPTLSTLMTIATSILNIYKAPIGAMKGQKLLSEIDRLTDEFHSITNASVVPLDEMPEAYNVRRARSEKLFNFCMKFSCINLTAQNLDAVQRFVSFRIRENPESLDIVDLNNIERQFDDMQSTLSSVNTPLIKPSTTNPVVNTLTKGQKRKANKADKQLINVLTTAFNDFKSKSGNKKGKTSNSNSNETELRVCTYCNRKGHLQDTCFHNPDRVNIDRPIPNGFVIKPRYVASINMMSISHFSGPTSDPALSGMDREVINSLCTPLNYIILDGGSSHNVLNRFYRHLILDYRVIDPVMIEGAAGDTSLVLEGQGKMNFLGAQIDVYYSPLLRKSVISDGSLCRLYKFSILKVNSTAKVTNTQNLKSLVFELSPMVDQYIIPPSCLDDNQGYDNDSLFTTMLASVRPSNPRTLWHARFGHAHLRGIISMAKQKLYSDRGLILPENLLKLNIEEDLCDSCAKGKPTFSHKFVPHTRSSIKGKLWYFDVSGGGLIQPSLVNGNIYKMVFADSCTRMYFPYYTKKRDDATVLKILQRHLDDEMSRRFR